MAIKLLFQILQKNDPQKCHNFHILCYTPLADPPLSGAAVVLLRPPCCYCRLTDTRLLSHDIMLTAKFHKNRANAQTLQWTDRQTHSVTYSDTNAEVYFRPEFSLRKGRAKPAVPAELLTYFTAAQISSPTGLTLLLLQLSLLICAKLTTCTNVQPSTT